MILLRSVYLCMRLKQYLSGSVQSVNPYANQYSQYQNLKTVSLGSLKNVVAKDRLQLQDIPEAHQADSTEWDPRPLHDFLKPYAELVQHLHLHH